MLPARGQQPSCQARCTEGLGASPEPPRPPGPPSPVAFLRPSLSCLCVLCCPVRLCWMHVCVPLLCARPPLPLPWTPDHRAGQQKAPRMGPSTLLLGEFENMSVTLQLPAERQPAATCPCPPGRDASGAGRYGQRGPRERRAAKAGEPGHGGGWQQWRQAAAGPDKRPKSSREGSGGPQESSRDKRPLSGPDVGTPTNPPV